MTWRRYRTVIERDAFATLRILTAAGMDFGSISFDIVRSGRATGGVRIMRPGHAASVGTSSPALPGTCGPPRLQAAGPGCLMNSHYSRRYLECGPGRL